MSRIDVTQEDRQYWKATVPVEDGPIIEITIAPEGLSVELVEGGEFTGVARWETWAELADALSGPNV